MANILIHRTVRLFAQAWRNDSFANYFLGGGGVIGAIGRTPLGGGLTLACSLRPGVGGTGLAGGVCG